VHYSAAQQVYSESLLRAYLRALTTQVSWLVFSEGWLPFIVFEWTELYVKTLLMTMFQLFPWSTKAMKWSRSGLWVTLHSMVMNIFIEGATLCLSLVISCCAVSDRHHKFGWYVVRTYCIAVLFRWPPTRHEWLPRGVSIIVFNIVSFLYVLNVVLEVSHHCVHCGPKKTSLYLLK